MTKYAMLFASALLLPTGLFSLPANAWNFTGHVVIGEIAYQNLTPAARKQVDFLTDTAYIALPSKIQRVMDSNHNVSAFAELSIVPDMIRKDPAQRVWKMMGETIPASLNQWDEKTTGPWHYINYTYPSSSDCDFIREPNIEMATAALYESFQTQPQAASLMFLIHLTGDAHQPTHTVAKSVHRLWCSSDYGGNKYTLKVPQENLHHLWDDGLGLLEKKMQADKLAQSLQAKYPRTSLPELKSVPVGDVKQWVAESVALAPLAYSVKKQSTPSSEYYQQGQLAVEKRLVLAGYRLADMLNHTFATAGD